MPNLTRKPDAPAKDEDSSPETESWDDFDASKVETRERRPAGGVTAPATKAEASGELEGFGDDVKVAVVLAMDAQGTPRDQVLALVGSLASADNDFIRTLSRAPAGQELIDGVVEKADSLGKKLMLLPNTINMLALGIPGGLVGLARRAINATTFTSIAVNQCFEITLTPGSWSLEALRKMYLAFRMVPKTHVKGAVHRIDRVGGIGSSFSSKGNVINMARLPMFISMTGGERATRLASKFLMKKSPYSAAMRSQNAFSMTALHEVGHAVDNKLGVMNAWGGQSQFGAWESYNSEDGVINAMFAAAGADFGDTDAGEAKRGEAAVAKEAGGDTNRPSKERQKARQDAYDADRAADGMRDDAMGEEYGVHKKDFDKVEGARKADQKKAMDKHGDADNEEVSKWDFVGPMKYAKQLFGNNKAKLKAFEAHPVMKAWNAGNVMDGYARTRSDSAKTALNGRSFHKAYGHQWVSYLVSAKDEGVSHYQFRAPGEWFAELYAHYYMDTLKTTDADGAPKQHPVYDWFHKNIHLDEANRPPGQTIRTPGEVARLEAEEAAKAAAAAAPKGEGAAAEAPKAEAAAPEKKPEAAAPSGDGSLRADQAEAAIMAVLKPDEEAAPGPPVDAEAESEDLAMEQPKVDDSAAQAGGAGGAL